MKILFAASECVPFIKTGGLADVVGALAPVLSQAGHDVRVILPLYTAIPEQYLSQLKHAVDFEITLGWRKQYVGIEELQRDGVTYYFVDNKFYFGRSYIYGMGGDEYERFGFFDRAVLNALPLLDFQPDVIHCNDWQTGMIPALHKIQYQHLPFFARIKTLMTIHNLQYQGIFAIKPVQDVMELGDGLFTSDKLECFGCANFLKAGLVYADEITTVSPSYADEIQTAYYGERLDGLLRARRAQLTGVLNGLDVNVWNPETDPHIRTNYSAADLEGKKACKTALQQEMGLEQRSDVPIIAMVTRLSSQKGLDLVDRVLSEMMEDDIQMVVLGMGEARYFDLFSWAEQRYPGRFGVRFQMDEGLSHRIYAGADMFLMPSRFEPCGLSQMISLRYGTVPIVRETGGLRDTVLSYNESNGAGNGFTFFNYNAHDMMYTVRRAIHYYHNAPSVWSTLMQRGMTGDYSWSHSAQMYQSLYADLVGDHSSEEKIPVKEADITEPKKKPVKKQASAADPDKKPAKKPASAADPDKKPAKKRTSPLVPQEKPSRKKKINAKG